jgi:hypothetical protein
MAGLLAALSRLDESLWRRSASRQDSITWLPLWLISQSGLWVGLDRDGRWTVGRPSGQVAAATEMLSPGWLPLLDHDESVVREEVAYASAKYGLPVDSLLQSLPIDDIIRIALNTSNSHWIDRALIWLEQRTIPEGIYELLPRVASSRAAGQRARQRAWRLMKQRPD